MNILYLILYIIAVVCLFLAAVGTTVHARINLLAMGLLFFVLVFAIQHIDAM